MENLEKEIAEAIYKTSSPSSGENVIVNVETVTQAIAALCKEEAKEEAVRFAEWLAQEDFESFINSGNAVWRNEITMKLVDTAYAYGLFVKQS